jgi:hypothetical protein
MGTCGPLSEAQPFWSIHSRSRARHGDGTWVYFRAVNIDPLEVLDVSEVTYLLLPAGLSLSLPSTSRTLTLNMGEMEKLESDTSSADSNHASDTKTFPLAMVEEPVIFDTAGKTRESAFDSESFESFYKPIESYEGYHRWDPSFQWEAKEEKKLVRKVSGS